MLTIKAEIQQDKQRSDGTYNVKMRFTLDRKVKRLSTNLFATPQDLTKSFKFKENTPIKKEIDCLVLYYREQCEKLHLDQNKYTLEEIINFLNGECRCSIERLALNVYESTVFCSFTSKKR